MVSMNGNSQELPGLAELLKPNLILPLIEWLVK